MSCYIVKDVREKLRLRIGACVSFKITSTGAVLLLQADPGHGQTIHTGWQVSIPLAIKGKFHRQEGQTFNLIPLNDRVAQLVLVDKKSKRVLQSSIQGAEEEVRGGLPEADEDQHTIQSLGSLEDLVQNLDDSHPIAGFRVNGPVVLNVVSRFERSELERYLNELSKAVAGLPEEEYLFRISIRPRRSKQNQNEEDLTLFEYRAILEDKDGKQVEISHTTYSDSLEVAKKGVKQQYPEHEIRFLYPYNVDRQT